MNIIGESVPEFEEILTPEALAFIERLEREFGQRRRELLQQRAERQITFDAPERCPAFCQRQLASAHPNGALAPFHPICRIVA